MITEKSQSRIRSHPRLHITLAAYSTRDLPQSRLAEMFVYGSEDGVLDMKNTKSTAPTFQPVHRGCHAGFGRYSAKAGGETPTISTDEQIDRTAGKISRIICNGYSKPD